ncbi:MAG: diguanylate cyclase [Acidobacteria bacterium]|nr:diguanylate cyclase [Acidobacteriota bacterium]
MPLRRAAKVFIYSVAAAALGCFAAGATHWQSSDVLHFICYLGVAMLASVLKVTLPGIDGTMSVNFLFILLGVMEMSLGETLLLGAAAVVMQCYWKPAKRLHPIHFIFNISQLTAASTATYAVYHGASTTIFQGKQQPLALMAAAITYFLFNTAAMSVVISLTEQKRASRVWKQCYFWSFPYYLMGAGITEAVRQLDRTVGWQTSLLLMPAVYIIYRSYRLYLGKLETEKQHVEAMAGLHLRTIEALALAIEAKDHTTHDHLQRVNVYAMEIAHEMGLTYEQKEALRAGALLHDIGKLAVPEHIISKPGKLTPEEFEKMKIHPVVGAEILEQVQFPYPVVPIVRSHHEKWDGTGYPDGLKGEEIPIGARILSTVDCLDALATDRQYRRALPLDEAMRRVADDAGKAFDPKVVEILQRRYVELERMAAAQPREERATLSTELRVERGAAPAAGFAADTAVRGSHQPDFLSSIAAARREAQTLFELTHHLGNSLRLDETLLILAESVRKLVPHDAIAIYLLKEKRLRPEFVSGENSRLFLSLEIPLGQGLSGWVAHNRKPILNGNPSVEPGYLNDPAKFSTLRSAVAVPLEGANGVLGVLTLYGAQADAFSSDHLRVLLAISSKLGLAIENALKYRLAETSATTDYLTGLLNARSLFQELESEMGRCRREKKKLQLLVCDLNGFKAINDRFGHMDGNRLLRTFAERLKETCRGYDCVARMGGDEFVIAAPGLPTENVPELALRIEEIAHQAGIAICSEDLLSASLGSACFPEDGATAEELLSEADRRMYVAKQRHYAEINASSGAEQRRAEEQAYA